MGPAFDQIVVRALAKDPAERYKSAGDLARAAMAAAREASDRLGANQATELNQRPSMVLTPKRAAPRPGAKTVVVVPTAPVSAGERLGAGHVKRTRRYSFATGAIPILLGAVIAVVVVLVSNRSHASAGKASRVATVISTVSAKTTTPQSLSTTTTSSSVGPPPFRAQMFSVRLPPGSWVLEHQEQTRPGYVDTRWHQAGDTNVVFLVDYTVGFKGDSLVAANSVRNLFGGVQGYRELSFAPLSLSYDTAQRWEYVDNAEHSIDTFSTACSASYAVRGGAPASAWAQYGAAFDEAIKSMKPSCV